MLGIEYQQNELSSTDQYFAKMGLQVRFFMPPNSVAPLAFYCQGDLLADYTNLELIGTISTMETFQKIYRPEIYNANAAAGELYQPSLKNQDYSLTQIVYDREERSQLAVKQGKFAEAHFIKPYQGVLEQWAALAPSDCAHPLAIARNRALPAAVSPMAPHRAAAWAQCAPRTRNTPSSITRIRFMFETSIAGSLPKPAWLAETNKLWPQWQAEGDALRQAKADATLLWIKAQEDAGLDIVGDGEQASALRAWFFGAGRGHRLRQQGEDGHPRQPLRRDGAAGGGRLALKRPRMPLRHSWRARTPRKSSSSPCPAR